MRHLPGQALFSVWAVTHRLLTLALTLLILAMAGLGLLAWRLSEGPLDVAWLAQRLESAANASSDPADEQRRLTIGGATLVWEGFRDGVDRPLDIRLHDISATDATGAVVFSIPKAEVSLSLGALLLGRLEPRAIELHGAHLRARRASDGAMTIDLGGLVEPAEPSPPDAVPPAVAPAPASGKAPGMISLLLGELSSPATDRLSAFRAGRFGQLRRVVISQSSLMVQDSQLGTTWRAPAIDIDLRRRAGAGGGLDGTADIAIAMAGQQARLRLSLALEAGARAGHGTASLTPVAPAALAKLSPALAGLGLLDASVALEARLDLGADLAIREAVLEARVGAGRILLDGTPIVLRDAAATAVVNAAGFAVRQARMTVAPRQDGADSVLSSNGRVEWDGTRLRGSGRIGVDRVAFADLPVLWPAGVSRNARTWIVENITAGVARDTQLDVALTANADFSTIDVTEVKGGLAGEDLTVHWLRPVPPLERGKVRLVINEPDMLDVIVESARQRMDGPRGEVTSGLAVTGGRVRITGLAQKDQVAKIDADLNGPVADLAVLLRHPRLHLLDRSPFELKDPGGSLAGHMAITVPLEHKLTMDDLTLHAQMRTDGLRLTGIAAGRDMEQGALDIDVTNDAIKIGGRATVAGIAAQLTVDLDFRSGGPAQVQQRITANGRAEIRQLAAAAGLDAGGLASGPATAQMTYTRRRDGGGELRLGADLRESTLEFSPLGWRKPPGTVASGEAKLRIQRDRILSVDDIVLTGDALSLRGRIEQQDGRLAMLRLERVLLGRTEAQGSVSFQPAGGRISVALRGGLLDLGPRLTTPTVPPPPARAEAAADRAWSLDARFDTAILAHDVRMTNLSVTADSNGAFMQRLRLDATTQGGPTHLEISPAGVAGAGRRLSASSADAGTLLRGLDVIDKLAGGRLSLDGSYDDRAADRPLSGSARIDGFRVMNAPAITGVLQAMTLYGLVQMAQGPGLGIDKLIAPFRMTETTLELIDARAFNSSLGMTIKGRVDRIRDTCDLSGTVVPAYFFNSLLGDIPLIGKLFAPEAGGGLFAASYTVRGKLADPQVSVNPLSALTPGFLRGLFDGF